VRRERIEQHAQVAFGRRLVPRRRRAGHWLVTHHTLRRSPCYGVYSTHQRHAEHAMPYLILVKHARPPIDAAVLAREWRLGDAGA
jgi:hypothetical protein